MALRYCLSLGLWILPGYSRKLLEARCVDRTLPRVDRTLPRVDRTLDASVKATFKKWQEMLITAD